MGRHPRRVVARPDWSHGWRDVRLPLANWNQQLRHAVRRTNSLLGARRPDTSSVAIGILLFPWMLSYLVPGPLKNGQRAHNTYACTEVCCRRLAPRKCRVQPRLGTQISSYADKLACESGVLSPRRRLSCSSIPRLFPNATELGLQHLHSLAPPNFHLRLYGTTAAPTRCHSASPLCF
jgi:hypothetical protein